MPYEFSEHGQTVQEAVGQFMRDHVFPSEETYYAQLAELGPDGHPAVLDVLKSKALQRDLWNLFLPDLQPGHPGIRLSNLDYAPISEMLGERPSSPVSCCAAALIRSRFSCSRRGTRTAQERSRK